MEKFGASSQQQNVSIPPFNGNSQFAIEWGKAA
jgi:hypothetical protein